MIVDAKIESVRAGSQAEESSGLRKDLMQGEDEDTDQLWTYFPYACFTFTVCSPPVHESHLTLCLCLSVGHPFLFPSLFL